MKHYKTVVVLFAAILLVCGSATAARAALKVVTTTQDLAAIAKEVGGDTVRVDSIAKGHQNYHFIQAKPSYMLKVNRADLFAYQGLELEIGWAPLILRGGRNAKVLPGKPGHMDVSNAIQALEIPEGEVDRSMGDIHPFGNPHYHLSPENAILIADAFAERLGRLDTENKALYRKNSESFRQRVEAKIPDWKHRLRSLTNRKVVTYHPTWVYFLEFFGIESIGNVEDPPGVEPGSRHLAQLAKRMQQTGVRVILQANYIERGFSDLLAERTQGQVVILPASVGGEPSVNDYITLLDRIVSDLAEALSNS